MANTPWVGYGQTYPCPGPVPGPKVPLTRCASVIGSAVGASRGESAALTDSWDTSRRPAGCSQARSAKGRPPTPIGALDEGDRADRFFDGGGRRAMPTVRRTL